MKARASMMNKDGGGGGQRKDKRGCLRGGLWTTCSEIAGFGYLTKQKS